MGNINFCDLLLDRVLSHLPSDPGLLVPSKRYIRGDNATRVHPYDPALSLCTDSIALVIFWLKIYAARLYIE